MTRQVIAIRPEPGLAATLAAGRRAGLAIAGYPLSEIHPLVWDAPDPNTVDALLLGSANAIRHGGPQLALYLDKPVFCVGETTAEAARRAGFRIAGVGQGGLQSVVGGLAGPRLRLLRLAGEDHVELVSSPGIAVALRIAYCCEPLPIPPDLAEVLAGGALVLLHSAAAARHFAQECDRLELPRSGIALATLGARISEAAGAGWAALRHADNPQDGALLSLARDMCQ